MAKAVSMFNFVEGFAVEWLRRFNVSHIDIAKKKGNRFPITLQLSLNPNYL